MDKLGRPRDDEIAILLAHNPKLPGICQVGADLVFPATSTAAWCGCPFWRAPVARRYLLSSLFRRPLPLREDNHACQPRAGQLGNPYPHLQPPRCLFYRAGALICCPRRRHRVLRQLRVELSHVKEERPLRAGFASLFSYSGDIFFSLLSTCAHPRNKPWPPGRSPRCPRRRQCRR